MGEPDDVGAPASTSGAGDEPAEPAGAHLDDHALWDLALGEPATPGAREHLERCGSCAREVDGRRDVVGVVADPPPADLLLRPPDRVLSGIRTELGLVGVVRPAVAGAPSSGAPDLRRGGVPSQRGGSRRGRGLVVAAGALGLVLGGAALGLGLASVLDRAEGEPVVARVDLAPVGGSGGGGVAVLRDEDGRAVLEVDLAAAQVDGAGSTYEEVWLLGPDDEPLVSLGVLGGGRGTFTVPAAAMSGGALTVDVSREPWDGRPEHSGDSLARGTLEG
ncbi:anti-sigma factor [Pseudokineococcus sp. 1T1Z-3]|uniref:anti-sigma factor n=1 Tax=Pseudokineococcus sp. 1T1Z-3 TaxID=3132745 RepID=UPI003094AB34